MEKRTLGKRVVVNCWVSMDSGGVYPWIFGDVTFVGYHNRNHYSDELRNLFCEKIVEKCLNSLYALYHVICVLRNGN